MKILIIEDEIDLASSINDYLLDMGFICEIAITYNEAASKLWAYDYDCILLDINLPDGNGFELIQELKKQNIACGIIVISARDGIDDKIKGLDLGADDYLSKPFNLSELNARVKSVIRRRNFDGQNEIHFNELVINPDNKTLTCNNQPVALTPKEYELFLYLFVNRGRILTKEAIVEHLWGDYMSTEADSFDFLYTHMRNLRKKLLAQQVPDYIKTIYSIGYKFSEE
ncbi:MAG: response regulator transcription factor [Marinifilaceae bacterium]